MARRHQETSWAAKDGNKKDVDDMEVCRRRLDLLGSESFQIAFALGPREALRVIH